MRMLSVSGSDGIPMALVGADRRNGQQLAELLTDGGDDGSTSRLLGVALNCGLDVIDDEFLCIGVIACDCLRTGA